MIKGTIKFFSKGKGFGFIAPDGGAKDVFLPMAVITASGIANLTAGQRVSFETEPDAKGPKAVSLTLLDEKPVVIEKPKPVAAPAPRATITLYHDPASEDSEDVLEALEDEGIQPRLVDYMATPPAPEELKRLSLRLLEGGQSAVRRYDSLFLALQLDDRFIGEADFWRGIIEHPALINGPIMTIGDRVRVCKTSADVLAFLGKDPAPDAPSAKPKGLSPRMLAMLTGGPIPERPEPPKKIEEPAAVKAAAQVVVEDEDEEEDEEAEVATAAAKTPIVKTKPTAKVTAKVEKKAPARKVVAKAVAKKPAPKKK